MDFLPEDQFNIVMKLKELIGHSFPRYREKLSYNVPFYYNRKPICFIWPSVIPWGNLSRGVALGFILGTKIAPKQDLLDFESRKNVGRLIFTELSDVSAQEKIIRFLLQEAYLLDEKFS